MDSPAIAAEEIQSLIRSIQTPQLQKNALQTICHSHLIPRTGNKSELQKRLIDFVKKAAYDNNQQRFSSIRTSVYKALNKDYQPYSPAISSTPKTVNSLTPLSSSPSYAMMANGTANGYGGSGGSGRTPSYSIVQSFQYTSSPFYEMRYRVGEVRSCEVMANHRNSITIHVKPQDHPLLQQANTDKTLRVMVFCAGGNNGTQDVSFPYQSELKVNEQEVKANLRGLKNKPGSTRPVDITGELRLKPVSYNNKVEFTYALTHKGGIQEPKKFYLGIYVCKTTSIPELAEQVRRGKRMTKAGVMIDMMHKAKDPDVIATSQNVDLKDPISFKRPTIPCRGIGCSHLKCFDAATYLELQSMAPQWICPICDKSVPFDQLMFDEYTMDILRNTASTVESVTIEPNGQWHLPTAKSSAQNDSRAADIVDDDDLVIQEVSYLSSRNTATPNRSIPPSFGTPVTSGSPAESSSAPRPAAGTKRPAAEVIDLTLSDDDDEVPAQRPAKRQLGSSWNHGRF